VSELASLTDTLEIVVDEIFPHAPETIWKTLTNGELIARWMMPPTGFGLAVGKRFTFQTRPAGEWDGVIHCQVLEVVLNERLAYSWQGGHEGNVGYGSKLDTIVTWTLTRLANGTRVRLVHSGFVLPSNDTAYRNMSEGWNKVVRNLDAFVAEQGASELLH
jgi:uncharacterized protein YndB with AHSA1/START domain